MGDSVVVPPPYKGQNDQFPLAVIQSPYCERMLNFYPQGSSVKLRRGNTKFGSIELASSVVPLNITAYGTTALFALYQFSTTQLTWIDMTAGGAGTVVYTPASATGDTEIHTLYFNGVLFYFGDASLAVGGAVGPVQYDGTTWSVATYTWPASFNPFGGCVHKNRGYFIDQGKARYAYSPIDGVSGDNTLKDLSSLLITRGALYIIRSISMSENVTQENIAAFLFSNGEVLGYGGSFPDGSDWGLVARFRISNPIYQNSFCDAKGDSFIFTETEILSLRNLFIGGYEKERSEGIGAVIKNRYAQIVAALRAVSPTHLRAVKGVYDERNDRLIVSFPFYVDPVTAQTTTSRTLFLIYDFTVGAWYETSQTLIQPGPVASVCYFNQNTYMFVSNDNSFIDFAYLMQVETKTDFLDDRNAPTGTLGITYEIQSAPLPISKFGVSQIDGIEAVIKSDLYSTATFKLIADLGRQTTDGQKVEDQGSSIAKPLINVGIEATFVQWSLTGSTVSASVGLELYALNFWYNQGQKGSR